MLLDREVFPPRDADFQPQARPDRLGAKVEDAGEDLNLASAGLVTSHGDVNVAASLLGYQGEVDDAFASWRSGAIHGADHEYSVRRAIVDAVPDAVLRLPPKVPALLAEFRAELRQDLSPSH